MKRRWVIGSVAAAIIFALVGAALWFSNPEWRLSSAHPTAPTSSPATLSAGPSRGLYASSITGPDPAKMDIPATIEKLKEVHADRYYYLIWDHISNAHGSPSNPRSSQMEWNQLPLFADAAKKTGIDVVVYLVPPAESNAANYRPFGWDYDAWFRAIGRVAQKHPSIRAIAMDDFSGMTDLFQLVRGPKFSPSRLEAMVSGARESAPWLKFYAVMYGQDFFGATATYPRYRSAVDGVIYAFAGPSQIQHQAQNSTDPSGAGETTRRILAMTRCPDGTCMQVNFPAPGSHTPAVAEAANARRDVTCHETCNLIVEYSDNTVPGIKPPEMSVWVDGVRQTHTATVSADFAVRLSMQLPNGRHSVAIDLSKPSGTRTAAIVISSIRIAEGQHVRAVNGGWKFSASSGAIWSTARTTALDVLFYCSPFGVEANNPAAATPRYVETVMAQLDPLSASGALDGLVAYRLNLQGARSSSLEGWPDTFRVVANHYAQLARIAGRR